MPGRGSSAGERVATGLRAPRGLSKALVLTAAAQSGSGRPARPDAPHATPRDATPRHATSRHTEPRHVTPRHAACHATLHRVTPRHAACTSHYVTLRRVTPRVTPRHATRHVTPRRATLRYTAPRHATPRHATLRVASRHAALRRATLRRATLRVTSRHAAPHRTAPRRAESVLLVSGLRFQQNDGDAFNSPTPGIRFYEEGRPRKGTPDPAHAPSHSPRRPLAVRAPVPFPNLPRAERPHGWRTAGAVPAGLASSA